MRGLGRINDISCELGVAFGLDEDSLILEEVVELVGEKDGRLHG